VKPRKACVRRIDDRAAALAGAGGRAIWQIVPVNGELGADEKPAKGDNALDAAPNRNAGQSSRYISMLAWCRRAAPARERPGWCRDATSGKRKSIQRQDIGVPGRVVLHSSEQQRCQQRAVCPD
jgi:hypothetical protein